MAIGAGPVHISTRPATHNAASPASIVPCGVCRPVQFLPAVKRKPTTAAAANPKTISCACQNSGAITGPCTAGSQFSKSAAQAAMPITAKPAASR